jgi:hypothetical protein
VLVSVLTNVICAPEIAAPDWSLIEPMITPVGEAKADATVSVSVKRAVDIRLDFFMGFSSRFDDYWKCRSRLADGQLLCQSKQVKLRKVDDYAVSLHLTLGAFKINNRDFRGGAEI